MGLDDFMQHDLYVEMQRRMAAAARRDRRTREDNGTFEVSFARGDEETNLPHHSRTESMQWMWKMRNFFKGCIIRRDPTSTDATGKPLLNLKMYRCERLELDLTETEQDAIESTAESLAKEKTNPYAEVSTEHHHCAVSCTSPRDTA